MRNLPLITIPHPFKYGFSFSFHQFPVVGTIYLLSVLEAVGDITATAMVSRRPIQGEEYQSRLKGGVLADGLVSVIASAVGSLPLTTFAQNNGVIQMTGVASRYVGRTIAVMLVILGLFPMIGGFFTTIPSAVLGGAMTLMFSMIAIAGIRIIITNGLKRRETLIVATSLGLGLGVSYDPEIFKILPASIYVLVENPICAGGLTAILLNIILHGGYRQEKRSARYYLSGRDGLTVKESMMSGEHTLKAVRGSFIDVTRTVDNPEEIASALRFIEGWFITH